LRSGQCRSALEKLGRVPPKQQATCVRWRAPGFLLLEPVLRFEQIADTLHGGIIILEHCAICGSSTGLPPLAEIIHSQYHGRSNALEDKHGVAYHRLFNKYVFWTKPTRSAGVKGAADCDRALPPLRSAA